MNDLDGTDRLALPLLIDQLVADRPETLPMVTELRELISRHEKREATLSALYDAARDLTKIRDLDHALQAVTDRTRRLLSCDVAYLSARTIDDAHFAVRAWSGQVSPAFLGTQVSVGSGVGGRVAATRRPFQVENYLEASTINHSDYLDTQVGSEGLVALLAVPLEVDGRLLGILFAGRREAQAFDADQVEVMSSLAAHAAVALDNALLFASQVEALDELERSSAMLRAHTAAVETAAEVHARLTEALSREAGITTIIGIVSAALGGPVAMVDGDGDVMAVHGSPAPVPPYPSEVQAAFGTSRESGRSVAVDGLDGSRWYVSSALAGSRHLGSIVLSVRRTLTEVDVRTLERATQTVAVSLLADAAAAEADVRAAGEVVRQLLRPHPDPTTGDRLARRHGLADRPVTVAAVRAPAERTPAVLSACAAFCASTGGLSAHLDDHVVVLTTADAASAARGLWEAVGRTARSPVTVAAAREVSSLNELHAAHDEAVQCLHLMNELGRDGQHATAPEFGHYALLLTPGASSALDQLIGRTIGALLEYDDRQQTNLVRTALAYLDASTNATAAAAALGIHANTMTQRLGRIDRVLGPTWRGTQRQLDVHHALRLHALRGQSGIPNGRPRAQAGSQIR